MKSDNQDSQEIQPSLTPATYGLKPGEAAKITEQFRLAPTTEAQMVQALERGAPTAPSPTPPPAAVSVQDPAAVSADPISAPPSTSTSQTMPQIADDVDLIEKEWVDKAKQIVNQTAHDPYLQNKEINKVKMDYLKKRYNKILKVSED